MILTQKFIYDWSSTIVEVAYYIEENVLANLILVNFRISIDCLNICDRDYPEGKNNELTVTDYCKDLQIK